MFKTSMLFLVLFTLVLPASAVELQVGENNLVQPLGSSNQMLILAAGSVAGGNDTFFRSDINLVNYRNAEQRVRLRWIPQGMTGTGVTPRDITIRAFSGIHSEDFAAQVMGQFGLGSILITAITADGTLDPNGQLYATARIWTPQPGTTNGTVSQTFPVIPTSVISGRRLTMIGLHRNNRYRANVGVVNLDQTNSQTYRIVVAGDTPTVAPEITTLTLPPLSMTQVAVTGPPHTSIQIAVENISAPINSPLWYAYGSSVDNVTGDSWSEAGFVAPPDAPGATP